VRIDQNSVDLQISHAAEVALIAGDNFQIVAPAWPM